MTHGAPLVRLCPEGFRHRPPRKTNPEGVRYCPRPSVALEWQRAGSQIMKSTSPRWVWVALVLAMLTIGYVAAPAVLVRQAAALWGWG
jgi:hypothetical protein